MNKYYIIIPIVCLAAFIFVERSASKEAKEKERQKIEAEAQKKADEEKKKKELEEKARMDSDRRNAERLADEEKARKKKEDEYAQKIQKMKDEIKKFTDEVSINKQLVAKLEKDLTAKREQRERENHEVFDLAKKVEITKKNRRSAELEVQRYTEMLTTKATESTLTKMPVVATAEGTAK
ncbi:MAG: hypothetical protein QM790_12270 [Nibricoccus sp.]